MSHEELETELQCNEQQIQRREINLDWNLKDIITHLSPENSNKNI